MSRIAKPIVVLTGPTASGKTALSLEIAKKYDCEIICADSTTVYRGMDIGTDKPNPEDFAGIPHHLLDVVNPNEEFNVSIFVEKVRVLVDEIHSRGKVPMLVGGSVMYIDAYIYDYQMPEVAPNSVLRQELTQKTADELYEMVSKCDPAAAEQIDRHNKRRLIRVIEVCQETGKPFSEQKTRKPLPENILYLALGTDRETLYTRIDKRVDSMFRQGFVDEVRELHVKYDHDTAMQAAGYRQIVQFLDGEIDLETAIAKTKQAHRNYAKRQLIWLRGNEDVQWIKGADEAEAIIDKFLL